MIGKRVQHIADPGIGGTIIEADMDGELLVSAMVQWDDGGEPDFQWGNKLVFL